MYLGSRRKLRAASVSSPHLSSSFKLDSESDSDLVTVLVIVVVLTRRAVPVRRVEMVRESRWPRAEIGDVTRCHVW
jgi:hypothetical protein